MNAPLPPLPTEDELVPADFVLRLTPFQAWRVARLLLKEARTFRRRSEASGFVPEEGKRDRNVETAKVYERAAEQLLARLSPERAAWARGEGGE
jgi:hypothetical protein